MRMLLFCVVMGTALAASALADYTNHTSPDPNEGMNSHEDIFENNIPSLVGSWSLGINGHDYVPDPGDPNNPSTILPLVAERLLDTVADPNDPNVTDQNWADGRYTIIARGGGSTASAFEFGYIGPYDPNDPNSLNFISLGSGLKSDPNGPVQMEVNFPGEGFAWAIKVDGVPWASNDPNVDRMLTYHIHDPNNGAYGLGRSNRHWIVFWEEGDDSDYNDIVFEIYKIAPMLRNNASMLGTAAVKYSVVRKTHPDFLSTQASTTYLNHYDAFWAGWQIPWSEWRWPDTNNPDRIYDLIYGDPNDIDDLPSSMFNASLMQLKRMVGYPALRDYGNPVFINDGPDTNPITHDDPNLCSFDPDCGLVTERNSWLLTKDGNNYSTIFDDDFLKLDSGDYIIDWGDPNCRAWFVDRALYEVVDLVEGAHSPTSYEGLEGYGFDGFSGDNCGIGAYRPLAYEVYDWKYKGVGREWQQHGLELLREIRDAMHAHGRYVNVNMDLHYYNHPVYSRPLNELEPNEPSDLYAWSIMLDDGTGVPLVDQIMSESPLKSKAADYYLLGQDWEDAMARHQQVIDAKVVDWWQIYPAYSSEEWEDRAFLYHYASFLLVAEPGFSVFAASQDYVSPLNINPPWYNEYDIKLGEALGSRVEHANGYFYREYENAMVVVNPTLETQEVDFGSDPNHNIYPVVDLDSGRGIILLPLYVPGDPNATVATNISSQPMQRYSTIQGAIDGASAGDCIMVRPGIHVGQVDVDKNIILRSFAPDDPNIVNKTVIYYSGSAQPGIQFTDPNLTVFSKRDRSGCLVSGFYIYTDCQDHAAVYGAGNEATLDRCIITNVGGISSGISHGIYDFDGNIFKCTVTNCAGGGIGDCDGNIFSCNVTNNGGSGIYYLTTGSGYIADCVVSGNANSGIYNYDGTIANCLIAGNQAYVDPNTALYGGGIRSCNGTITNCTIADNYAYTDGGGIYDSTSAVITSCIVWGNTAGNPASDSDFSNTDVNAINGGSYDVTYSCFGGSNGYGDNIDSDPMLDSDYGISCYFSECIDAGNDDETKVIGLYDLNVTDGRYYTGNVAADLADGDVDHWVVDCAGDGRYANNQVDMGAYEWRYTGNVLYVDDSASTGGDGSSWCAAYQDLQDAIDSATADPNITQIWVAAGTYNPPVGESYTVRNDLGIYGGFAGSESSLAQRDYSTNVTTLDGDEAAYSVVSITSRENVRMDGFTITGSSGAVAGGGVLIGSGSDGITIANCIISDNDTTQYAAAAYITGSSANIVFDNCTLESNTMSTATATYGGAIAVRDGSSAMLDRCKILSSTARVGGGLYIASGASLVCYNSLIAENASYYGGGVYNSGELDAYNCTITENTAHITTSAWGVYHGGTLLLISDSIIWGNGGSGSDSSTPVKDAGSNVTIVYSDIQTGGDGCTDPNDCISSDPLFSGSDYTLQTSSPCKDQGSYSASSELDLAGNPRVSGSQVDIGAYEIQQ